MSKINILSPYMADLIAAGEVVERPASVVKELMENAIDADARNIVVEIRGGGIALIRVTDDGHGMAPEDAGVAFLRHATSKVENEQDLESISSLGFRGEALAAISGVSRIELFTREEGEELGTYVSVDSGDIQEMDRRGGAKGTSMSVRDLFFNTPARLKFMKTDRAESAACVAIALRCAMAHPEISVRVIKDGKEEFFTPGDSDLKSTIYSLLGREFASGLLECGADPDEKVRAVGYVSSPTAARGNRSMQYFYCNGRYIKSNLMQAALEQAYKNTTLSGRFPSCVIKLSVPVHEVDVNVHPTKTEVRFAYEKAVFEAVYYSVLGALERGGYVVPMHEKLAQLEAESHKPVAYESSPLQPMTYRALEPTGEGIREQRPIVGAALHYRSSEQKSELSKSAMSQIALEQAATLYAQNAKAEALPSVKALPYDGTRRVLDATVAEQAEEICGMAPPSAKVVGEVMGLYIIAELGDTMAVIDKHAAHERLLYDKIKSQNGTFMSQTLLDPVFVTVGAEATELLTAERKLLSKVGFELEAYGDTTVAVRAAPSGMAHGEIAPCVEEFATVLLSGGTSLRSREELFNSVSCKAAVKGGYRSELRELEVLAAAVCAGKVIHCPHGRPVAWRMSRAELDKRFDRA